MIFENVNEREEDDKAASLLLTCGFFKERYHRSCSEAKDEGFPSFCGKKCQEISGKAGILLGVKHEMEEGLSWTLLHRSDVDVDLPAKEISREVECNCKIAVALSVMDECFLPMPDHRSGINLILNIMYNCGNFSRSNFNRLDFSGFNTITLEKGEEIVAAASIRVYALESKSNNGSDQLVEDIDAQPVVDENGTSTSEATPLNVDSGGMNHEEEDVSDMKSSDCGGCVSEDIPNVVADLSEVPTLEAPLEVYEGGTNDGGTLNVNTAECGDQPFDVESMNNEKRVDLEGKNNHDIVLDGGGTNDGGTSNVNNTEDTLAHLLKLMRKVQNHEMRVDLEEDNNHEIVLDMKSSNHEGQLEVINTARAGPHEEGTMSHQEEDTSLIPRPVAVT